ncbi:archaellin/type IV pilin N-terminal domain-containing protein [Natronosalvus amylolyticus]|uniref:archaellin/type IV pilin N-terminal domain-containing protein n=1 Tax=Natronosalvus amylolyticus TaxID=2961994 RepID=UPI0020C9CB57|nr:archaellin/type IV pilin N-terminal domain-containing protein [Natronosalvus amylolyticus]
MFETITDEDERGQVGIGTLIVFIAMVLVAAIAAGVLINTAGSLQSQASDTGTETQQAVANQIEVTNAVGIVNPSQTDNVSEIDLTIKKSAGSDVIDITALTVQYTSTTADRTLEYESANLDAFSGSDSFATADASEVISGDTDDTGLDEAESLTETSDRIVVRIDVAAIEGDDGLDQGSSATINFVDQSGAQYTYGVTIPATWDTDNTDVVEV